MKPMADVNELGNLVVSIRRDNAGRPVWSARFECADAETATRLIASVSESASRTSARLDGEHVVLIDFRPELAVAVGRLALAVGGLPAAGARSGAAVTAVQHRARNDRPVPRVAHVAVRVPGVAHASAASSASTSNGFRSTVHQGSVPSLGSTQALVMITTGMSPCPDASC
jgi:hypothetical protein